MRDVNLVGGKNASLGEMIRELTAKGVKVPNGFATTAAAYREFIKHSELGGRIKAELADLDPQDVEQLQQKGERVRKMIMEGDLPPALKDAILEGYRAMNTELGYGKDPSVAVRSSATAEDLPDASFAGQQETFLNVTGEKMLLRRVKECIASLFTDRAISYRQSHGFDHSDVALSIGIQKMVRSDTGSAGVMFTLDTESGNPDMLAITGSFGLGELVVQGAIVTPHSI